MTGLWPIATPLTYTLSVHSVRRLKSEKLPAFGLFMPIEATPPLPIRGQFLL